MSDVKLPLSGNVMQTINPWTNLFNPVVTINLGNSSNPEVEKQVLSDVASYGKQLGRISEALAVLLAHFHPEKPLSKQEQKALHDLERMLEDIADVKERHAHSGASSRSA
jgi:hypothetical protein